MKLISHYLVYDNRNLLRGSIPPERFTTQTRAQITAYFLSGLAYFVRRRMLPLRFIEVNVLGDQREVSLD
jgi:hypothetical protein